MIPLDQRAFLAELGGGIWTQGLAGVFQADGWDFVTNGHALLRLRGASPGPERDTPRVKPIFEMPRPSYRTVAMSALCAWAEKAGPYRCQCSYCGSPRDIPETIRSQIGGVELNRCLLWHYLKGLPREGNVTVSWGAPLVPLLIAAEDWELLVMPLAHPGVNDPFDFGGAQ